MPGCCLQQSRLPSRLSWTRSGKRMGRAWLITLFAWAVCACGGEATETVRIGGTTIPDTTAHTYWLKLAEDLRSQSGGTIAPTLYVLGQLGSDEQIFNATRRGRVNLSMAGHFSVSAVVPEIGVVSMPYLFESEDEVQYVLSRHVHPLLAELLAERDIVLLQTLPMGWLNIYAQRPILAPEDLRGYRTRAPVDIATTEFLRALGADLIPLSSDEIVPSLQTGLVNGGVTVSLQYHWAGIGSEAPHLSLTQHAFLVNFTVANAAWWEALPESARQLISGSLPSAQWFTCDLRASEQRLIDELRNNPRNYVHAPDREQLARWETYGHAVHADIVRRLGGRSAQMLEVIETGKRSFAARRAAGDKEAVDVDCARVLEGALSGADHQAGTSSASYPHQANQ